MTLHGIRQWIGRYSVSLVAGILVKDADGKALAAEQAKLGGDRISK
jgi:hypothetical protein